MEGMPEVTVFSDKSKCYELLLKESKVLVYTPGESKLTRVVNFGFRAPFFLVFDAAIKTMEEAKRQADEMGFSAVVKPYGTAIVFVRPAQGSFANAADGIYQEVIENARIGQYYKDSVNLGWNRFKKCFETNDIRGGVQRAYLYGKGEAGDYIAGHLLKTVEGRGLYGPGDITPAVVVLDSISQKPEIGRRDIPIVSAGNSVEINDCIKEQTDFFHEQNSFDCVKQFENFGKLYHRMVGNLIIEPDFDQVGFVMEPCVVTLKVSPDNAGDDKDKTEHQVGYVAYYNRKVIEENKPVPLVLCFHGGGDSAMCMASVSGWYEVARKYNFLLVAVENHLESTAGEMQELLEILEKKYPVDKEKIYASGFSMGGCKSWDMMQEYPKRFAAVAPMCATFEVGLNSSGNQAPRLNQTDMLPVFYVGGEQSPLPELPFQADKCLERMKYVLTLNHVVKQNPFVYEDQTVWEDRIYGIKGDVVIKSGNPARENSILTMNLFQSENGRIYTVFGSVSDQQHEVRMHSCEHAYRFMSLFRRTSAGEILGGENTDVIRTLED